MTKVRVGVSSPVAVGFLLIVFVGSAIAQTASTSTGRNEDGSIRISVAVTGAGIQDVHLCVAKTKHTETKEATSEGDPLRKNYANPAGASTPALPAGWTYEFVEEPIPGKEGESRWCIVWRNANAALPAAGFTFVVDYSGSKDVAISKNANVYL